MTKIDWNEQFKIRPRRNASVKHEISKLLIVLNLLEKYKKSLYWVRIYIEYPLGGKLCDVYFENIKKKEIHCFEIQKNISKNWLEETQKFYEKFERPFFKTDWILIREENLSDDIKNLNEEIKGLIA